MVDRIEQKARTPLFRNVSSLIILFMLLVGSFFWLVFFSRVAHAASHPSPTTPSTANTPLPTPPWWSGTCDDNNYFKATGHHAFPLGSSYRGLQTCGPLPEKTSWPDPHVYFFPGDKVGALEWECVELSMRYLYLAYGIQPYHANGKDVVWNYSGTLLQKIQNGTANAAPQAGDVLSYSNTKNPKDPGHTSIVKESKVDGNGNGYIIVIDENDESKGWEKQLVSNWVVGPLPSRTALTVTGWLHAPASQSQWSIVPSPNVGSLSNVLNGVAAISSNNVWSVGYYTDYNTGYDQTLIEQWNGTSWSLVSSPNAPGSNDNHLNDIASVPGTSQLWAVGYYDTCFTCSVFTLIEHYNGTSWSIIPSPNANSAYNNLVSVTAISVNDVWAIGWANPSNAYQTLIEHYDGTSWSVVSSPNVPGTDNNLEGVSADSSTDVWAVGDVYDGQEPLIEHYDGTSWNIVSGASFTGLLIGIVPISPTNIWATGFILGAGGTIVEHYDGTKWSLVSSPNPGTAQNSVYGASADTANDMWTVGTYRNSGSNVYNTLMEHYDGTSWSAVPSPNVSGATYNDPYRVLTISPSDVWAVGFYIIPGSNEQTLIEHYGS